MKRKKLNYKKLLLANLFILCLYLFVAIHLSYDFVEQCIFACLYALITLLFNLFITEKTY